MCEKRIDSFGKMWYDKFNLIKNISLGKIRKLL